MDLNNRNLLLILIAIGGIIALIFIAIVAIIFFTFILGLLAITPSQMEGGVNGPIISSADVVYLVKQAIQSPGQHFLSTEVLFNKGQVIASIDLSRKAQAELAPDQICLLLGKEYANDSYWINGIDKENGGTYIQNGKEIDIKAPFSVVCEKAPNIENTINERYGADSPVALDALDYTKCGFEKLREKTACVVVLRKT